MQILQKIADIQAIIAQLKSQNKKIGFVPTMGALHSGHISLVELAHETCDIVIVSIFVNPTQFNDTKDFDKYPRTMEADRDILSKTACDILFVPSVEEMYQNPILNIQPIELGFLDQTLEGAMRPGHYQGVVTIVEKLLLATKPDKMYLGLKDYQQVMVIDKLAKERFPAVQIIGCPTVRELDGLAKSSRNTRLSDIERQESIRLYQCIEYIKSKKFTLTPIEILEEAKNKFLIHPLLKIDYIELRDATTLLPLTENNWANSNNYVILIAVFVGEVRLIDNLVF